MALQPIDLQMLFSQLDKVGKDVSLQKDGAMLREAIAGHRQELRNEIKTKSVNETQETNEGLEKVNDKLQHNGGKNEGEHKSSGKDGDGKEQEAEIKIKDSSIFRDPDLGNYVDISG